MGRISMPQGKGSQLHNRRDYERIGKEIPDNIDSTMSYQNITLIDKDIRKAYQEIFGAALAKYNAKQKRADRKIENYYEHIQKSKNGERLFYEDIIQWGKKEDFENNPQLKEKAKECLEEYARTFESRNPNLKLIGAYIHMDEASPHLHLDYIPVAHGYSRGLNTRNSLDKAMKEMGFIPEKESRKNNATKLWKENERAYFGEICRSRGLEVEAERKARGSLSVEEYKEAKVQMLGNLVKEKWVYQCKNEQLKDEINSKNDELLHIQSSIENRKFELVEIETSLAEYNKSLLQARNKLNRTDFQIKLNNNMLQTLKTQIQANTEQIKALGFEVETLDSKKQDLDTEIANLELKRHELEKENTRIRNKIDKDMQWYKVNQPKIATWKKSHDKIKENITAILHEFWYKFNIAINMSDADKALDVLDIAKNKAIETTDKYIPEIAKEEIKQDIQDKTDIATTFINRRKRR